MQPAPTHPLVSIILATYNRRSLVPRAINSVFRQTYRTWELIIIDDGSTDGSFRDLTKLAQQHPNIRLLVQKNRGLASARNAGIALAQGVYTTFLDSDDEYLPRHLASRVRILERRPDLHFLVGGFEVRGPRRLQYVADMERPGSFIHLSRCLPGATLFSRTSVLRQAGGLPLVEFAEDYWLIRELFRSYRGERARSRSYVYHTGSDDRMCVIYSQEALTSAQGGAGRRPRHDRRR
jgi:glycosyltransferase involved in cell wall biosynthesis